MGLQPVKGCVRENRLKTVFDILVALVLFPIALVVCLVAACAICLETKGSPLFFQSRLGREKRPFKMWKLRSMHQGTAQRGSHEVGTQQITKVGRVIRRTKIDELPQLVNVLRGEMSFVGPRPALASQTDVTDARDARGVHAAKPGITGLSQIRGIDMSRPEQLAACDAEYLANQSFLGDLQIILRTATGSGQGDPANQNTSQSHASQDQDR